MPSDLDQRESDFNIPNASEEVIFQPRHQFMASRKLREQDLRPQRLFFYKRITDNEIICWDEQYAALMMKSSHRFILQQLGVSDGSAYRKFIDNCGVKPGERVTKLRAREILEGAYQAELAAASGHYANPDPQNVHYDESFPLAQRSSFVPPP